MRIEGTLHKDGRWWVVDIPMLVIGTQGHTKKEACEMAKDAVEALVFVDGFEVTVYPGKDHTFSIEASDDTLLMAKVLKQLRGSHQLTVRDVAERMGTKSHNAYAQYEQAKVKPSLDKFTELIKAITGNKEPVLKLA